MSLVSEICRRLKRHKALRAVPIIMLTARAEEADRIRGLDTGADDYITKPFSPKELIARINAILRRVRPALAADILEYDDIILDNVSHRVTRAGQHIHLGPTEFKLLRYFMEKPSRVYSREQLLDAVWGHDVYLEIRTVDVHIRLLRKALDTAGTKDIIRTIRSAGYALGQKYINTNTKDGKCLVPNSSGSDYSNLAGVDLWAVHTTLTPRQRL